METDYDGLADDITDWARSRNLLVQPPELPLISSSEQRQRSLLRSGSSSQLPVVLAHGMGDSCFNGGMQSITKQTSDLLGGVYTVCIPTGKNQREDTINGYFMSMNKNVEIFAEKIRKDPHLKNGFHAVGFSQGNNVVRGYLAKHNDPPIHTFISINGVNAGVGAVPYCEPSAEEEEAEEEKLEFGNFMCNLLMEQASKAAYNKFAQEHSFQSNYWRDPRPVEAHAYKTYSQLAAWNNEGYVVNQTLNENWAKTEQFVWVLATQDGMVWPREGEWWGAPDPTDPFKRILPMKETEWYKKDLFGLKTAQEAGKNAFESFKGDHLQFTDDDYKSWVATYLAV